MMRSAASRLRGAAPRWAPLAAFSTESSALPLSVQTALSSRGPGGRHSISGLRVCVFGSTGFLGRYVVNSLGKMGSLLSLPTRCSDNNRQHLRVMGDLGQVVLWDAPHDLIRNDEAIRRAHSRAAARRARARAPRRARCRGARARAQPRHSAHPPARPLKPSRLAAKRWLAATWW